MFSDLFQGFTADSETMDPGEMVALLNEYFGDMVAVVFHKRGTLDKFMGDALMATWGRWNPAGPARTPGTPCRRLLKCGDGWLRSTPGGTVSRTGMPASGSRRARWLWKYRLPGENGFSRRLATP